MASKQQMTGMLGVYLVAAELSRLGFIVSPTSRSARGADLLVTDQRCKRAYSVQVKSNASTFSFWNVGKSAKSSVSPTHVYVLVNIKGDGPVEYFVVPSRAIRGGTQVKKRPNSVWCAYDYKQAAKYQNNWRLFGKPK
jgi:hypothetical protein